ncbi:MAG: hypothetical protein SGARI_007686 [Bacillariaceae sp.]
MSAVARRSNNSRLTAAVASPLCFNAARRTFAEDSATKAAAVATKPPRRGGGLMARISSFLVGAGLTALATQFYIFQELREGNKVLLARQKAIEARLNKLEGGK